MHRHHHRHHCRHLYEVCIVVVVVVVGGWCQCFYFGANGQFHALPVALYAPVSLDFALLFFGDQIVVTKEKNCII